MKYRTRRPVATAACPRAIRVWLLPVYTATLVPQAGDALAGEHAERGRTPVMIFDEAHLPRWKRCAC